MELSELDELVKDGYPRPQLVRREWFDLSGQWEFAFDDGDVGIDEGWWEPEKAGVFDRTITVPFPPESSASGIDEPGFHPVGWYRLPTQLPGRGQRERLLLHFGAVDYNAHVFVNGSLAGAHSGGNTPFTVDISHAGSRTEAVIVVRAEDRPDDVHQPRGKQDWQEQPHRIWYKRTTGIWQTVWMEVVPHERIASLDVVPDIDEASVTLRASLTGQATGGRLSGTLLMDGEVLAQHDQLVVGREARLVLAVPAFENAWDWPRFRWSPEHPQLLSIEVSLVPADGVGADTVTTYVGMRSVGAADRQFLLNEEPRQLRMVLSQGYWPGSHLAAPGPLAAREEVELIKALGFNGARIHQKIEDPRFLYWADRLGLMIWEEMPSAGAFSNLAVAKLLGEWREVLERDRGHPCIVAWVLFNESWGVPGLARREEQRHYLLGMYHLTRSLDPSRLVVTNDGWEHLESDIWGIHDYTASPDELRRRYSEPAQVLAGGAPWPGARRVALDGNVDRGQPIVLSEFGGVSMSSGEDQSWHGYSNVASPDELAKRLEALFSAVHDTRGLAGFCYTQFADTEQESNGLVTAERRPKVATEVVRAMVEGQAAPRAEG